MEKIQCSYCKNLFEIKEIERDHIIPVSKGGLNEISNLIYACGKCNRSKSNKDLEMFLLQNNIKDFKKSENIKQWTSTDWEISKFTKKVRISEQRLNFLKKIKGKKSVAGILDDIIENYTNNI